MLEGIASFSNCCIPTESGLCYLQVAIVVDCQRANPAIEIKRLKKKLGKGLGKSYFIAKDHFFLPSMYWKKWITFPLVLSMN